ncbi:MAG: hypothetical protein ACREGI_04735 [Candidatus Levyibacteriota bacterium]
MSKQKGGIEILFLIIVALCALMFVNGFYINPSQLSQQQSGVHPVAPPCPTDVEAQIQSTFHIIVYNNVGGTKRPDEDCWMWKKFWDISNTKFFSLIPQGYNIYIGLNQYNSTFPYSKTFYTGKVTWLENYDDELQFNIILLHELGHTIDHYNADSLSHGSTHITVWSQEGGITQYGIYGSVKCDFVNKATAQDEDYAEMITYYLNPTGPESTACGGDHLHDGENPYDHARYPLHKNLAQQIIGLY